MSLGGEDRVPVVEEWNEIKETNTAAGSDKEWQKKKKKKKDLSQSIVQLKRKAKLPTEFALTTMHVHTKYIL